MTLNKKKLRKWAESARIILTHEQERLILEAYGTESEYGWSEQDISQGIRRIMSEHPAPPPKLPNFLK